MKIKLLLTFCFSVFVLNTVLGCSCSTIRFCEFVNSEYTFLAFRGNVIKHSEFESSNGNRGQAIYVKIIKKYKDDLGVGDTIKLYGSYSAGASCTENYIRRPIGSTMICAIGDISHNDLIYNPDSLAENYWEWFPNSCYISELTLRDDTVEGIISTGVNKYPLDFFEEKISEENLSNCNFSYDKIINVDCIDNSLKVYPNPSLDGAVFVESNYFSSSIGHMELYHIDGGRINSLQPYEIINIDKVKVEGLRNGLNILKIKVENKTCIKYVLSL